MTDLTWTARPYHRDWLMAKANALFDLFQTNAVNPRGGFHDLDAAGRPFGNVRQIHSTARMVHCFAIAAKLGRPGADTIVDHGMHFLWNGHRDQTHGGYCWSLDDAGYRDDSKQAYGHAFVLLAAADVKMLGHPLADKLLADITEVLETRFWEEQHGAVSEEYARDWSKITDYRGQNSNMHLTEALMAAFEATGDREYLNKAERISELIIARHAAAMGYRVVEHFDRNWNVDDNYKGNEIFRPSGGTPGHWLEWARLLMQLWHLGGRRQGWLPDAAAKLFASSITEGWDKDHGGFFYTVDWSGQPRMRNKLWWPACEGIGACHFLASHFDDPLYEEWYRRIWGYCNMAFIDHDAGGWFPEVSDAMKPSHKIFTGKPDIYHALQACLIPLYPATASLTRGIAEAG